MLLTGWYDVKEKRERRVVQWKTNDVTHGEDRGGSFCGKELCPESSPHRLSALLSRLH